MDIELLKRRISRIGDLPSIPSVVTRLNDLVRNPNISASQVGDLISGDPALTAKALKLVNSAFYGFPAKITSITRAIVILGFQKIRNIALSATVFDVFKSGELDRFDYEGFWEHSLGCAVTAEIFAKNLRSTEAEDAFIAGLVHDIGKIVMAQYLKKEFKQVVDKVSSEDILFLEAEEKIGEFNHGLVGYLLANTWNFPDNLKDAIRYHNSPAEARENVELVEIIHVSDIITRALQVGNGGDRRIPIIYENCWHELSLSQDILEKTMTDTIEGLDKAQEFFEMVRKD